MREDSNVSPNSTYHLSSFSDSDGELSRLKKQAALLPKLELEFLVRHGMAQDMKVLDAACGPGVVSFMIDDFLTTGSVVGVDLDPELIKDAQSAAAKRGKEVEFHQANALELPFENEFDFIYCRFLFQHLAEPEKAMRSLFNALKPGGILCITDVDDEWLFLHPEVPAFDQLRKLAGAHQALQGGNRYIGRALRHLLKGAGYSQIKNDIIPVNSDMIGIDTFIQITTRFKKEIVRRETGTSHPDYLLKEIDEAIAAQDIFGMIGVFSVSGQKPFP